jgi:type II secretory pathway pseudopilin PulG
LASFAAPAVSGAVRRAREAALAENLAVMRRAIDSYYSNTGTYPASLETMVEERYLRFVPDDPVSADHEWRPVFDTETGGVIDVKSGSADAGLNEIKYDEW